MPGTLQVGGNTVLTHTGDAGAGTNTINSAVVFPAGHIIQIAHNSKGDENSDSSTSASHEIVHDSSNNNEWFVTISNITSGNKILLMFTFCTQQYGPSVDSAFGGYGICRDSLSNMIVSSTGGNSDGVNTQAGAAGVTAHNTITLSAFDTPTASSHSYYLTYRATNSNYSTKVRPDIPAQFFAFEVQQ